MGGPPANDLTILQLQIITELTVRLAPVLPLKVALTSFPTVAQAVSTVVSILSAGMAPTSLELLDGTSIRGLNLAKLLPESLPEEPTVLMRFSNPDDQANFANLEIVRGFVHENGGRDLKVAKDEKENDDLWTARKVRSCTRLFFFFLSTSLTVCSFWFPRRASIGRSSCSSARVAELWCVSCQAHQTAQYLPFLPC